MSTLSRRRFLGRSAGAVGLVLSGACRGGNDAGADPDLAAASRAAGMETVLAGHYRSTTDTFTGGRMGAAVPQVLVELVTAAARHHQEHLDAWNALLAGAGRPAGGLDLVLVPALEHAAGRLPDIPAVATLALRLEDYASQTYLALIPTLRAPATITLAGQILVVDSQHQAVLRYLLGLYPVGSGVVREVADAAPADPRASLVTG